MKYTIARTIHNLSIFALRHENAKTGYYASIKLGRLFVWYLKRFDI